MRSTILCASPIRQGCTLQTVRVETRRAQKSSSSFEKSRQHDLKSKNAGIRGAAGAYGDPGQKNGVTVAFGDPGKGKNGTTTVTGLQKNADGSYSAEATVTIRPGQSGAELDSTVGHEGQHVEDAQGFASTVTPQGYYDLSKNLTQLQTETNAYGISNAVLSDEGATASFGTCSDGPCMLGFGVDKSRCHDQTVACKSSQRLRSYRS